MDVPERHILVKPISRISSDQVTTSWLYASEGLTDFFRDPDAILRQLLLYVPNYTPSITPMSYEEKWPFITRILVNYYKWETSFIEERAQMTNGTWPPYVPVTPYPRPPYGVPAAPYGFAGMPNTLGPTAPEPPPHPRC